jgi:hypothetical protein
MPKPMTSGAKSDGRYGKQDFVYLPTEDVYRCPAAERLTYRYTNEEDGKALRRYWTTACPCFPLKARCTTGSERRITRWEHEHVLEAVQQRVYGSRGISIPRFPKHMQTAAATSRNRVRGLKLVTSPR